MGAVVTKTQSNLGALQGLLDKYKNQIAVALPKHMTPERMIRVALTAVSQSPKLQECNPLTICGAIVQASILGLEPSSVLGECFLVPFFNKKAGGLEAQLIIGYQGKIKLVANTGQLMGIKAAPVRENDEFEFDDGIEPFVKHKYYHVADRGKVIGFWAGAKLKSGFMSIAYMSVAEAQEHRDKFAMTKDRAGHVFGVWADNFEAMALKTVIHKCMKYIPKSAQAQTAWSLDERAEAGLPQQFSVDVPLELHPGGSDTTQIEGGEDNHEPPQLPQRKSEKQTDTLFDGAPMPA